MKSVPRHPTLSTFCFVPVVQMSTPANSSLRVCVCTEHQKGLQSVSVAMATKPVSCRSFFWGNQGPGKRWFLEVLTQTGIKVGQKDMKENQEKGVYLRCHRGQRLLTVTPSKWKWCVFFEALGKGVKSWISLPFTRERNLVVCVTGRAARQAMRHMWGLFRQVIEAEQWLCGVVVVGGHWKLCRESTALDWDVSKRTALHVWG